MAKRLRWPRPIAPLFNSSSGSQQELATSLVPNSLGDTVIAVKVNRTVGAAAALLLFTAIRASAHHSFAAEYDENKLITIAKPTEQYFGAPETAT